MRSIPNLFEVSHTEREEHPEGASVKLLGTNDLFDCKNVRSLSEV
jgi:hypothetical protein